MRHVERAFKLMLMSFLFSQRNNSWLFVAPGRLGGRISIFSANVGTTQNRRRNSRGDVSYSIGGPSHSIDWCAIIRPRRHDHFYLYENYN